jgi:hypothetical protein
MAKAWKSVQLPPFRDGRTLVMFAGMINGSKITAMRPDWATESPY